MILDLSNKDVIDYLFKSLCYVIDESKCTYLKWDMNRIFSDYYSMNLKKDEMMELNHRYYIGLYSLFKRLKMKYPKLLIEGCASGGNRFDLGILSYCPQIWASDNTDAYVRMNMQYNYSYGYPISTLGAHIASSPCLNTLRRQSLDTRKIDDDSIINWCWVIDCTFNLENYFKYIYSIFSSHWIFDISWIIFFCPKNIYIYCI